MKNLSLTVLLITLFSFQMKAGDSISFSGQASAWAQYSPDIYYHFLAGARYIPRLDYSVALPHKNLIDFEASVNINGSGAFRPFEDNITDGYLRLYRLWARISGERYEVRAGLQKINFGSASMLRPLEWFDRVDPRDPLKLTNGVYGILGRYYFSDNTNMWLWVLYGNEEPKMYEIGRTNPDYPEIGGRIQTPVPGGEAGISYHFRVSDTWGIPDVPYDNIMPENRLGIDAKWDVGPGIWIEGSWIGKYWDIGEYTNEEMITAGTDYTFGIGNGLYVVFEQSVFSLDEKALNFRDPSLFSALSLSYPAGIFDNLGAIVYYDWTHNGLYSYLNWKKTIGRFDLYLIGYWNPEQYLLPVQRYGNNFFSGKGIQVMLVLNH